MTIRLLNSQNGLFVLNQLQHQFFLGYLTHFPILVDNCDPKHDETGEKDPKRNSVRIIFDLNQVHSFIVQSHSHQICENHQNSSKVVLEVGCCVVVHEKFRTRYDVLQGKSYDFYDIVGADYKSEAEYTETEFANEV